MCDELMRNRTISDLLTTKEIRDYTLYGIITESLSANYYCVRVSHQDDKLIHNTNADLASSINSKKDKNVTTSVCYFCPNLVFKKNVQYGDSISYDNYYQT